MITKRNELYKLLPQGATTVELGVAEGLFSRDILNWGLGNHFLVDAWKTLDTIGDGSSEQSWHDKNYENAIKLINPFGDRAIVLRGLTTEMANYVPNNSVDLLYHDAGHDYGSVYSDLVAWYSKVKAGGVIAFHDYENPAYGVKLAVQKFVDNRYQIFLLPETNKEDAGAYFIKQ